MTDRSDQTSGTPDLAEALVGLSHHVLHLFAEAGRGRRLTQQQVELVCAVIVPGRIRMADLGRRLHLERSGLSNLVDRLERRGLVKRVRDADDRRATWIELTPEGTEAAMGSYREVTAQIDRLLAPLSASEQQELTEVVDRMRAEGAAG